MKRVLFVCLGNICRSPAAEGIFRDMVKKKGLTSKIHVDSCGTGGWHEGDGPDDRMIRHAAESSASQFVVATEIGVLHRMRKANPAKEFLPIDDSISCRYMKMITLEKLRDSLRDLTHRVTVEPALADRGRLAIERMIAL